MLILVSPKSTLENVNICVSRWSWGTPVKELLIPTPQGATTHGLRTYALASTSLTEEELLSFTEKQYLWGSGN